MATNYTKDEESIKKALEVWYREKTLEKVKERVEYYQGYFKDNVSDIKVKEQKKRWASCTARNMLVFNWRCVIPDYEVKRQWLKENGIKLDILIIRGKQQMKLIEVESDINNRLDLLIEHKILNNNSHHLNYILTKINNKFYFVDAKSELVTIKDDLICPYCLQNLTINRTYKKNNGTIVQFFVRHKSKNKMSESCIFKQNTAQM